MHQHWYFLERGQVSGPHDADRIKEFVAQSRIPKTTPIWPVGGGPKDAIPADEVMIFTDLPGVPPSILAGRDETGKERAQGPTASTASHELPPWLDDLRVWMGLEVYAVGKAAAAEATVETSLGPPQAHSVPDWLAGWLELPGSANPCAEEPVEKHAPVEQIPLAYPVKNPVPAQSLGDHAEKGIQETGFDPRTGRILDPERFRRWKQEKSQLHPENPELIDRDSMMEAFRSARTAIESWLNDEANRLRVLYADLEEIRKNLELQTLFQRFARYGPTFEQRMQHHLELTVVRHRKANQEGISKNRS